MWNKLMGNIDVEEPTRITDQVCLGCSQRESETKRIVVQKSELFNKLRSSGASTMKHCNTDTGHNVASWSHDMQGHAPTCVEGYCELANKTTQT